jgi:prepilin signal peptidase PulO-like enzyme (type II secretory pathway)
VHHLTDRTVQLAAGFNPFNGVSPSFGPFQGLLTSKIGMFLALVWALCFVYTGYHLMTGVARLSRAKKGGYGDDLDDVKTDVVKAAAATIGLVALPVIYGILISS